MPQEDTAMPWLKAIFGYSRDDFKVLIKLHVEHLKSAWHRQERIQEIQWGPQKSLSLYTSTGVCSVGKAAHIPAEETRRAAIAYGPGHLTRQRLQKELAQWHFLQCGYEKWSIPKDSFGAHRKHNTGLPLSKVHNPNMKTNMVTNFLRHVVSMHSLYL